jgi:hypothetical protein
MKEEFFEDMDKKADFNHKIDADLKRQFEEITSRLPGKKYEKVEAGVRAFIALSRDLQLRLLSGDPDDQKLICELIHAIQIPVKQDERARRARTSKSP